MKTEYPNVSCADQDIRCGRTSHDAKKARWQVRLWISKRTKSGADVDNRFWPRLPFGRRMAADGVYYR